MNLMMPRPGYFAVLCLTALFSAGTVCSSPDATSTQSLLVGPHTIITLSPEHGGPLSNNHHVLGSGIGFEFAVSRTISEQFALRLTLGISGVDTADSTASAEGAPVPPGVEYSDVESSVLPVRYFLSAEYRAAAGASPHAPLFSLFAGLGAVTHFLDTKYTITNDSTGEIFHYSASPHKTRVALTLGVSMTFRLSSHLGVAVGTGTDLFLNSPHNDTTEGDFAGPLYDYSGSWGIRLGLAWLW